MVAADRERPADVGVVAVDDAARVDVHDVAGLDRPPRRRRVGAAPDAGPGRHHRLDRGPLAALLGHDGVQAGGDLELGLPGPQMLDQVVERGVDDRAARRTHSTSAGDFTSRTRSTTQSPETIRPPSSPSRAARASSSGAPGAGDQRSSPIAPVEPSPRAERVRDRVEDVLVAVEDRVVVVGRLPHERLVALVVAEHEPLVVGADDDADGARGGYQTDSNPVR